MNLCINGCKEEAVNKMGLCEECRLDYNAKRRKKPILLLEENGAWDCVTAAKWLSLTLQPSTDQQTLQS